MTGVVNIVLVAMVLSGATVLVVGCYQFFLAGLHIWRRPYIRVSELYPRVAIVIPAWNEGAVIGRTIDYLLEMRYPEESARIYVVDDGSTDETAAVAESVGAVVVRHPRNRGKAAALMTGVRRVAQEELTSGAGSPARHLLFVDADLEDSAGNLGVLIPPVVTGQADLTIANLPPQKVAGGGRGLVVNLSRRGIERLTGFSATQPLSGMRCLTRAAFDAASPLARGWGVETGMTIDVLRAGLTVREVPCELHHRVSGAGLTAQLHRAAQYRDVALALLVRGLRRAHR